MLSILVSMGILLFARGASEEENAATEIHQAYDAKKLPHVLVIDDSADLSQALKKLRQSKPEKYQLVIRSYVESMVDFGKSLHNIPNGVMVELDLSRSVGITEIGFDAFRNCTSLTGIFIPSSVTQIAQTAFEGCTSLTKFTVDERNHYFSSDPTGRMLLSKDGKKLLAYPSATGNVIIPASITEIGNFAFYSCTNLTSITIPGSVTDIWGNAFS